MNMQQMDVQDLAPELKSERVQNGFTITEEPGWVELKSERVQDGLTAGGSGAMVHRFTFNQSRDVVFDLNAIDVRATLTNPGSLKAV